MVYRKLNLKTGDQFKAESLGHIETALAEVISSNEGKATSARVETLEALGGLSPESPVDGQTANLVLQADSLTKSALDATYASNVTVADIESSIAPQKMIFGLPIPQPNRAPNLAIQRALPDGDENIQVIFTEGDTLWGWGRDRSLYKTVNGQWQHTAYLAGLSSRGGMARCLDGSLLHFSASYTIRRSTDEGETWTDVLPRRATGLEPLSTQSMVVHPVTGHIYYGEYTNGTPESVMDVVLWRSVDHGATWQQFYTWPHSRTGDPGRIAHIHAVQIDPFTEDIYVMLGDGTDKTGIWKVSGETCVPVLTNDMLSPSQIDSPRAIGLMFFPDYVAWGSDSTSNPYLFRIPRTAFGTDPSKLERGARLSSTAWGTARASEDGSRWVMFTSDEAFPNYAADRMAHIYTVEDQGATIYEVGSIPSRISSGVTTLMPLTQPEKYGLDFWFAMRTGAGADYGAWQARIGYGGQTIPWPTQPKSVLKQSQSSGLVNVPANTAVQFGVSRAPVYANRLAIYDTSLGLVAGSAGTIVARVTVGGNVVWSSSRTSARAYQRAEYGAALAVIPVGANTDVKFEISNSHASTAGSAVAGITYAWVG